MIYNQQSYVPIHYGDEEIVQDRILLQKFYLNSAMSHSIINEIQKQTLQSEESLYNFFSTGIEKEWYSVVPEVEKQDFNSL